MVIVVDDIQFPLSLDDLGDLALQRTGELLRLGGGVALNHWFRSGDKGPIKSFLNQNGIATAFLQRTVLTIQRELAQLETCVDFGSIKKLTSVGPGLCLIELMIWQRYRCEMYLIDIEHTVDHQHGFHEMGSGYSNNSAARHFLESNGVPPDQIRFCNPTKEPLDQSQVDLIISILSMGFHYPVRDYVPYISNALRMNGTLAFDKRKGVQDEAWDALSTRLRGRLAIDFGKFYRLICEKAA